MNQTPFYAESGGQVGDTGVLTGDGARVRITDTQKKAGDLYVHLGTVEQGTLKPGLPLQLEVDHGRRTSIRANHSATHLLHEALRQVLGDHIAQRGSLVSQERLRFDFAHNKPITPEELRRIEDIANDVVLENGEVVTRSMAIDDARSPVRVRCSAKNMATRCVWYRWAARPARVRQATRSAGRSSYAAARMSSAPATSA
jgi:alanyl-tRNA synthetase